MGIASKLGVPRRDIETISISRPAFLAVIFFKYLAKEIEFEEMRRRMLALNLIGEWVEDFNVSRASYHRVTTMSLGDHVKAWRRHLDNIASLRYKDEFLLQASADDFPRDIELVLGDSRKKTLVEVSSL